MLAKENRLTQSIDFKRVKEKGRVVDGESFSLAVYFRGDDEPSRFGFIITTNISKNASKRNMIKRALSEALRQEIAFVEAGHDGVFMAKPKAATTYMATLMSETKSIVRKAGITK